MSSSDINKFLNLLSLSVRSLHFFSNRFLSDFFWISSFYVRQSCGSGLRLTPEKTGFCSNLKKLQSPYFSLSIFINLGQLLYFNSLIFFIVILDLDFGVQICSVSDHSENRIRIRSNYPDPQPWCPWSSPNMSTFCKVYNSEKHCIILGPGQACGSGWIFTRIRIRPWKITRVRIRLKKKL